METKKTIRGCNKKVKKCSECGKLLNWNNKSGLCSAHLREKNRREKLSYAIQGEKK